MGKHLRIERWMDEMPSTKNLRLKRVSAEKEAQFPRRYREILRDSGPAKLTKQVMIDEKLGLAAAWDRVKEMVNGR